MSNPEERVSLVGRDTIVALVAIAVTSTLAWWWLATSHAGMGAGGTMEPMPSMDAMGSQSWSPAYGFTIFLMWTIMMVAMMLPSAAPMIMLHARTAKDEKRATAAFAVAYLAVWTGFSALATAAQWLLSEVGWLNDTMQLQSRALSAALLAGAGLYQLTPIKQMCLSHCRSPLSFLLHHWRPGISGAIRMGLSHGAYCVGCCWFIMALLFVGGVMNLAWIATLAGFVMVERLLPFGDRVGKAAGVVALLLAAAVLTDVV